jgi:hypothetical protein
MEILDFIVCDDIRREVGNKHTIVGAYNDRIVFSSSKDFKWGINKSLGFFLRFQREASDPDYDGFDLKIFLNDEQNQLANIKGGINVTDPIRPMVLDIVFPVFNFTGPGSLIVKIVFLKGSEVVIADLPEKSIAVLHQNELEVPKAETRH